jgi:hypothetical protein
MHFTTTITALALAGSTAAFYVPSGVQPQTGASFKIVERDAQPEPADLTPEQWANNDWRHGSMMPNFPSSGKSAKELFWSRDAAPEPYNLHDGRKHWRHGPGNTLRLHSRDAQPEPYDLTPEQWANKDWRHGSMIPKFPSWRRDAAPEPYDLTPEQWANKDWRHGSMIPKFPSWRRDAAPEPYDLTPEQWANKDWRHGSAMPNFQSSGGAADAMMRKLQSRDAQPEPYDMTPEQWANKDWRHGSMFPPELFGRRDAAPEPYNLHDGSKHSRNGPGNMLRLYSRDVPGLDKSKLGEPVFKYFGPGDALMRELNSRDAQPEPTDADGWVRMDWPQGLGKPRSISARDAEPEPEPEPFYVPQNMGKWRPGPGGSMQIMVE